MYIFILLSRSLSSVLHRITEEGSRAFPEVVQSVLVTLFIIEISFAALLSSLSAKYQLPLFLGVGLEDLCSVIITFSCLKCNYFYSHLVLGDGRIDTVVGTWICNVK